jgi:predicted DNA-binding protein
MAVAKTIRLPAAMERRLNEHSQKIRLIPDLIAKVKMLDSILVSGNPIENEPSLLERIRNMEKKLASAENWLKTIALLFLTEIVTNLFR